MTACEPIEAILREHGAEDFRWIDPADIVVAHWVRMKCRFGCAEYGHNACCPPNTPPVADCERFFREYEQAVLLHFAKTVERPEDRFAWTKSVNSRLVKAERAVFLSGVRKAFLLFMDSCCLCTDCAKARQRCNNPAQARPSPEAMAVDVFTTARRAGYTIEVLPSYTCQMHRFALLMVE